MIPTHHRLQSLARYKLWANVRVFSALTDLGTRELEAPQPIVFGSLIGTLHHTYAMDEVWRAHLLGQPHGHTTRHPTDSPSLEVLRAMQEEIDTWYVGYADELHGTSRDDVVEFEFIGGGNGAMTREEIVLHVVNHGTYHRGHVSSMMYQFGISPPTTDLPVFLQDSG